MSSQELKAVIKDFIQKPNKEMALMIDGKWGVGKTYFLMNLPQDVLGAKCQVCHVSLKGISSLEDISRRAFGEILNFNEKISWVSNKLGKWFRLVQWNGISVDISSAASLYIRSKSFPNKLFVFDDLERIPENIPYKDVLFYIHSTFLENKSNNVIVVTNSSEMFTTETSKGLEESYQRAKEKIIERTIPFEYQLLTNYTDYLQTRYANVWDQLKGYFQDNELIPTIFQNTEETNIRQFNRLFDCFVRIHDVVSIENGYNIAVRRRFLNEVLGYLYYCVFIEDKGKNTKFPHENLEWFHKFNVPYVFLKSIDFVFKKGFINQEFLSKDLANRNKFYGWASKFQNKLNLMDGIYKSSLKEVKESLDFLILHEEALQDMQLYYTIYNNLEWIKSLGLLDEKDFLEYKEILLKHFKQYVIDTQQDDEWLPFRRVNEGFEVALKEAHHEIRRLRLEEYEKILFPYQLDEKDAFYDFCDKNPIQVIKLYRKHIKEVVAVKQFYEYIILLVSGIRGVSLSKDVQRELQELIEDCINNLQDPLSAAVIEMLCNYFKEHIDSQKFIEKAKKKAQNLLKSQNELKNC